MYCPDIDIISQAEACAYQDEREIADETSKFNRVAATFRLRNSRMYYSDVYVNSQAEACAYQIKNYNKDEIL